MEYHIPFSQNDIYKGDAQHRINFFGSKGIYTAKERLLHVMNINSSVFCDDTIEELRQRIIMIFDDNPLQENRYTTSSEVPQTIYKDFLPPHLQDEAPTIHHIIFQNKDLGGHPSFENNQVNITRGKHNSLHWLLSNENLYPHQQLCPFLKREKDYLPNQVLEKVNLLQEEYESIFKSNPFTMYKRACFERNFIRKFLTL